jgi:hypothetical protein
MSSTVLTQIARLQTLSVPQLQDRWRQLMGTEPPRYTRDFLIKRLAYRLQELAYGGLSESAHARMDEILDAHGYDDQGRRPDTGPRPRRDAPLIGTRLIREWNGERHEVTVISGGYEYQGIRYRSLSAIAKRITGTHWNGRAFFGLRPSTRKGSAR